MTSLNIDYLFNRVYDFLLWIKYVWVFFIWRTDPEEYITAHKASSWDGLRDRGWIDPLIAEKHAEVSGTLSTGTMWEKLAHLFGRDLPDSDHDGIVDISDPSPYDPNNLSAAQIKERFQVDYTGWDSIRDYFGFGPLDTDKDGVPDSYEIKHGLNSQDPDSDHDGLPDGQELYKGTDPLNNDSDHDWVIDGRDAYPTDGSRSVAEGDVDSDHDGIGDISEKALGTDPHNMDSDHDGIPDSMDTYPMDAQNIGSYGTPDLKSHVEGLHLSIQNPIFAFLSDILSIVVIFGLLGLAITLLRFFWTLWKSHTHYEHHFEHTDIHKNHSKANTHDESNAIPGLAVVEEIPKPLAQEFDLHPRWAIIEGYMSAPHEAMWRIGILEADTMLKEVLQAKGYVGEDVGELLGSANFRTIQLAWDAHKIRNRIAHEGSEYTLTDREAKRAFALFESVFRELKVI